VGLGEWVLRTACSEALNWPPALRVAINVSPAQFKKNDLAEVVEQILRDTGLEPSRLDLEVTESLLLRDVESTLRILRQLKALGVKISMDDFGTGYSSLANLRSFPFDKIKIDKSFVGELDRDEDSAAIVRAVLALGASLGMKTCAEGVETWPQLEHLRTEGCDEVQGYLYSKPKSATETRSMLDRGDFDQRLFPRELLVDDSNAG
jgi:EAL domain-containing protein (putative c-di-GMP-specific phosphodiesterase class I)